MLRDPHLLQPPVSVLLGSIADDLTGATDLALMLVRAGVRTVQINGVPEDGVPVPDADAVVVALKTRTIPATEAVRESLRALSWLRKAGTRQIFFKYCSTFDSTPVGNIGPVTEALLEALNSSFTVACPAFPANGRTVYQGHLFVGQTLLSESSMRTHPLTPMTDSNLVRVLSQQMWGPVGLIPYAVVRRGEAAIREAITSEIASGRRCAIVDALADEDLHAIGAACADLPLITGGSGLAMGLPQNFRRAGFIASEPATESLSASDGGAAVLSGSCSAATREQVVAFSKKHPSFRIDPLALAQRDVAAEAVSWARAQLDRGPVLIFSTAAPTEVADAQAQIGREEAGRLVERAFATIASGLVGAGVRRLVVAGGETAGAVVSELGVRTLRIGPEICPGVPWTISRDFRPPLSLALKSGNFGPTDFFTRALGFFHD